MKIAVDARLLFGGGIGRFIREVSAPWTQRTKEVDEVLFLGEPEKISGWLREVRPRVPVRVLRWPDPVYSARAQLRGAWLGRTALKDADVTLFPHYDAPVLGMPSPSVVVVHDLTQFQPGAPFPVHKKVLGGLLLDAVIRRADRVVTVSESSRLDLERRVPALEGKTRVVYNGVSETFLSRNSESLPRWDSLRPFILTVGEPRPHKRIDFAVEVLAELHARGRDDVRLLAVGVSGGPGCSIRRLAVEHGVSDAVVSMGRVSDDELRCLYMSAEALLFPSSYEGFGLPVAEALACGCPVLASDRAGIPEAAAGGGNLLDPMDLDAWVEAFLALADEESKGAGPRSWADTSADVFDVLVGVVQPARAPKARPSRDSSLATPVGA